MIETIPEFSRLISVARIPALGMSESLQAKPEERKALAKRFDLIELSLLTAQLNAQRGANETVTVTGKIAASIVQQCVVTLEPLHTLINLDVDIVFIPAEEYKEGAGSEDLDDEFELFSNGKIDLGEMVAQQLGVAIDPYPRKPDAALPATEFGAPIQKLQPFAQLAATLKNHKNKDGTKD